MMLTKKLRSPYETIPGEMANKNIVGGGSRRRLRKKTHDRNDE